MQLLSFCVLGLGDMNIIKGSVTKCINLACTRARYLFARNLGEVGGRNPTNNKKNQPLSRLTFEEWWTLL